MPDLDKTGPANHGPAVSDGPQLDDPAMHGLGVDDEKEESEYVTQRVRSRLAARSVWPNIIHDPSPVVGDTKQRIAGDTGSGDGSGVGIMAGLGLQWNGSERRSGHHRGGLRYGRRQADVIRYGRQAGPTPGVLGVDGNYYINLGQVSIEKIWEMRSLIVLCTDPWTAGSGGALAASFSGTFTPTNGVLIADLMSPGAVLPLSLTWSHDQQLLYGGDTLYVIVHSPGVLTYIAIATVMEYDWEAYRTRL